jgi:HD-like signal output (HDOD) protein
MIAFLRRLVFGTDSGVPAVLPARTTTDGTAGAARWAAPVAPVSVAAFGPDAARALLEERVGRIERLFPASAGGDARAVAASFLEQPDAAIRQLPAAAQQALALTQLAEPSMPRLVAAFERDPSLAQALLRHANSALHAAAGRPCYAVIEALGRVGLAGARQAVLSYSMEALICRPGDPFAGMSRQVWEHMVRTATIARAVAPGFGADPDEAASLALLHDVGKLMLFDRIATLRTEWRRDPVLPPDALRVLLRELHEPLGGLSMHRWSLGETAAAAVAMHHRAPAPPGRHALGETLYLAEAVDIAAERRAPLDLDALWQVGRLGGSAVRIEAVLRQLAIAA